MNLIIVESPTKAKTLSRFLGQGYVIEATMGHIKDLPKSTLGIDIEHNFQPEYLEVEKRLETVKKIQKAAKTAAKIYLATDPDREGEAIASHVKDVISKSKSSNSKLARIVFHEITPQAVEEALHNPRQIDVNLVDAQIGRRVLDRLVGYKLSPLLWKKVRIGLSAGRVQTVAVRLIVEKEADIKKFKPEEYWEIFCRLKTKPQADEKNGEFVVQLIKINDKKAAISDGKSAKNISADLEKCSYVVAAIEKKEVKKHPYPPFTTSTLTQAAARIMFWSAKKTMSIAQALYEEGLITYHRTDSTNIAASALTKTREYIQQNYGEKYLPAKPNYYKTSSKVAQEAHEAIRPTNIAAKFTMSNTKFAKDAEKLYELIRKRFVACQMADSLYDETTIDVEARNTSSYLLRVSGQIMLFDGWRRLFKKLEETVVLPQLTQGQELKLVKVESLQKFTQPPARYTEASLIKMLEKLGIGRPSTYAPIISTILARNYVVKEEGKFLPTPVGEAVNTFLIANFPDVFEYSFTAKMEDDLDNVARGEIKWTGIIGDFWQPFTKKLEEVTKKSERVKIAVEKTGQKCPECKQGELVIRIGRFGKFISCSRFPDCKYTAKYIEKTGQKCPECKQGDVVVKLTKKRRKFYGCSRYPDCKWASWRKPGNDSATDLAKEPEKK